MWWKAAECSHGRAQQTAGKTENLRFPGREVFLQFFLGWVRLQAVLQPVGVAGSRY